MNTSPLTDKALLTQLGRMPLLSIPKRLVMSDWAGHIPFAFMLIEAMNPQNIVELGVYYGDSFCAFCQALKQNSFNAKVHGIDTWKGDIHIGEYGPEVLEDLKKYLDSEYQGMYELHQMRFDDALEKFPQKSIDLLHIDGEHTYKAVKNDFESWFGKVADGGVILLHDTNVFDKSDYGVYKYWNEISLSYPSFRFNHSNGLGVVFKGEKAAIPPSLQWLFALDPAEVDLVRSSFQVIGNGLVYKSKLDSLYREYKEIKKINDNLVVKDKNKYEMIIKMRRTLDRYKKMETDFLNLEAQMRKTSE